MARLEEIPPTPLYKGGNIIYGQGLRQRLGLRLGSGGEAISLVADFYRSRVLSWKEAGPQAIRPRAQSRLSFQNKD